MPFPKGKEALEAAGYTYENDGTCRACKAKMQWWRTPNGKMMPMDADLQEAHWATCPNREKFKKK